MLSALEWLKASADAGRLDRHFAGCVLAPKSSSSLVGYDGRPSESIRILPRGRIDTCLPVDDEIDTAVCTLSDNIATTPAQSPFRPELS